MLIQSCILNIKTAVMQWHYLIIINWQIHKNQSSSLQGVKKQTRGSRESESLTWFTICLFEKT